VEIHKQIDSEEPNEDRVDRELHESDLLRWRAYKKEVGESRAEESAGRLVAALNEKTTPETLRAFLVQVLGYQAPYDVRATIHDSWYSVRSVLRSTTKLELSDLIPSSRESGKEGGR
jgi:hypothetical protein